MKLLRRRSVKITGIVVLSLAALLLFIFWPGEYISEKLAKMSARRKVNSFIKHKVLSYKYESIWDIFPLDNSAGFIFENVKEDVFERYCQADGSDAAAETAAKLFLEKLELAYANNAREKGAQYLKAARLFWQGIEEYVIDSFDDYGGDSSAFAAKRISIRTINPPGSDILYMYVGKDGECLYPLPYSDFYLVLADELTNAGLKAIAAHYCLEAAFDEAHLGILKESTLKKALLMTDGIGNDEIEWETSVISLLDTIHTLQTILLTRELIERERKYKHISILSAQQAVSECDAIEACTARDYVKALRLFNRNLSAGFPSTPYYISLCSYFLGVENAPGANMRDISEELRKYK